MRFSESRRTEPKPVVEPYELDFGSISRNPAEPSWIGTGTASPHPRACLGQGGGKSDLPHRMSALPTTPIDEFEFHRRMSGEEVWTYLGVGRSEFFELKRPGSPNFDPDFPKPIALFGKKNTWRKGDVLAYVVAREKRAGEVCA